MVKGLRGRRLVVVVAIVVALVAGGAIGLWLVRRPPPQLPQAWQLTTADLTDEENASFIAVDGTVSGELLQAGDHLLAMMISRATSNTVSPLTGSVLVSLDRNSGEIAWTLPLRTADDSAVTRCTIAGESLYCLGPDEAGKGAELLTVDLQTGQVLDREPIRTDAPAALVPIGEGLLAISRFGEVLGLTSAGEVLWSREGPAPHSNPLISLGVRTLGEDVLIGYDGEQRLISPDGTMQSGSGECDLISTQDQSWACGRTGGPTIGYDATAERLWEVDEELVTPSGSWGSVMAVHDGGTVTLVDPVTGALGESHPLIDLDGATFVRQHLLAEDAVLLVAEVTEPDDATEQLGATVSMLDLASDQVSWTIDLDDDYVLSGGAVLVGDTVVVTGDHTYGLDAATGEQLWEYAGDSGDVLPLPGVLVTYDLSALTAYEVPA